MLGYASERQEKIVHKLEFLLSFVIFCFCFVLEFFIFAICLTIQILKKNVSTFSLLIVLYHFYMPNNGKRENKIIFKVQNHLSILNKGVNSKSVKTGFN